MGMLDSDGLECNVMYLIKNRKTIDETKPSL